MNNRLFAILLCPAFLLNSCKMPFQHEEGDGSGYLFTYTLTENPDNLDPQIASNSAAFTVLRNMMQGLLEEQPDGTLTYGTASHYSITEDGLRYTFTLRSNSYWYYDENKNDKIDDGEKWNVTAEDFVFAFQRLFQKETKSPYRDDFRCISGADAIIDNEASLDTLGVYAENSNTLIFELSRPCAEFLTLLSTPAAMPCSRKFFEQTGGRYGLDEDSVISNNGFYMRRWFYDPYGSDNLIYLSRNSANDTVQKVYPSDVTFLIRNGQTKADEEFSSGKSDILSTSVYYPDYSEKNGYSVTSWRSITLGFILNTEWEAFKSDDIRMAFSASIPRNLFSGNPENDIQAAYGIIPPETRLGISAYSDYVSSNVITDMSENEISSAFKKGMHELGLTSFPSADILVCEGVVPDEDLYEIIQVWQSFFGFYAGIKKVSESEYYDCLSNKDYAIALYPITGIRNSALSVLDSFRTGKNRFYYSNKELDSILDSASNARDWEELAVICRQAEEIIESDNVFLPAFYKNRYLIHSIRNRDISYDPYSGILDFRRAKYYSD
ncbi:MAG: hypothetical protein K2H01_03295 [Ruminococcus sp.]|nr:hypothetical protein [Ruminococcus sp.]